MKPVTIVIPAYGHVESFRECVQSVLEFGNLGINRLLIVNDSGPEAASIEEISLGVSATNSNVSYARNNSNLGFVKTCNRAVYDLDDSGNDVLLLNSDAKLTPGSLQELSDVLHSSEKHGVACPRSSNAGLSTLPFYPRNGSDSDDESSFQLFEKVRSHLPRFTVTPVAVGFCILIKRHLIDNFELFDPIYSPGYDEENDFCMRVNETGYSAVMANHAFVFHLGSKSFKTDKRKVLQNDHHQILLGRYPFYNRIISDYINFRMDPVDVFADYIFPKVGQRPKILLDLSSLGPVHNGSSRVAIPVLERFAEASQSNYQLGEFTIRAPAASIEFFRLDRFGFTVITTESTNDLFFDVGVAISPIWHLNQIHFFNLSCARWVVTHFDVISLRTHSLLETEFVRRQVVLDSVRFADDIITISEFAATDLNDFFAENFPQTSGLRTTTLTLGAHTVSDLPQHEKHAKASEECSILIIGNHFKHKQVLRAVKSLAEMGEKIVVLGGNDSHKISECVEVIGTGKLTDQEISDLYQASSCVVFPSHYEGYGLPIAEAQLHQKPMVLFDSAVSREVVEDIGFQDGAIFFSTFGELREAVCQAALIPNVRSRARRTIEDYAEDVLNLVINRAGIIVDTKQLKSRVSYFRSILAYESREVSELTYRLDRRIYRAADRLLNSFAKLSRYFANRTKVERPANSGDMSIHGARRWT